jgi:hypothetical protein
MNRTARGHDNKNRKFGVIITFSEKEPDVDELLNIAVHCFGILRY